MSGTRRQDLTLYADDDAPPDFEATREEFLRKAQERAKCEEFEIKTANTVSHHQGVSTTLLECWIPASDEEDSPPEKTAKPEATLRTELLKPVFKYMRWSTTNPEDDDWTHWYKKEDTCRRIICPGNRHASMNGMTIWQTAEWSAQERKAT